MPTGKHSRRSATLHWRNGQTLSSPSTPQSSIKRQVQAEAGPTQACPQRCSRPGSSMPAGADRALSPFPRLSPLLRMNVPIACIAPITAPLCSSAMCAMKRFTEEWRPYLQTSLHKLEAARKRRDRGCCCSSATRALQNSQPQTCLPPACSGISGYSTEAYVL